MVVQLADFITCINLEVLHIRNSILDQRKIELAHFKRHRRTHRSPGNFHGGMRHLVHRHHKAVLHHLNNHHHNNQREPKEQRKELDKEHRLVADDGFHGNVRAHVSNRLPGGIFEGPIHREEPAKVVIRNNGFNFLAVQKLRQIFFKRRFNVKDFARCVSRHAFGIEVKNHMAAIRQNFVHIYILCLRETFSDARKNFARALVAFNLVTPSQVIIHLFGIDGNRRRFGHAFGDTDKIIDAVVTVQEESDHAR